MIKLTYEQFATVVEKYFKNALLEHFASFVYWGRITDREEYARCEARQRSSLGTNTWVNVSILFTLLVEELHALDNKQKPPIGLN